MQYRGRQAQHVPLLQEHDQLHSAPYQRSKGACRLPLPGTGTREDIPGAVQIPREAQFRTARNRLRVHEAVHCRVCSEEGAGTPDSETTAGDARRRQETHVERCEDAIVPDAAVPKRLQREAVRTAAADLEETHGGPDGNLQNKSR